VLRGSLLAAVLGAALAGCGAAATGTPVATTSVGLPPSYKFEPPAIRVAAGSTVTWTNDDHFTHSVQFLDAASGAGTDAHLMDPGQTATLTLTAPGTWAYQCSLHPQNMRGTVVVDP